MSLVKNALDFILWDILRIRRPKYRSKSPSIKTLRTYPPGGDPVDDMIEFVLKDGGSAPSGFRQPPREHSDT